MSDKNIAMLQETLEILEKGSYPFQGKTVSLKLSYAQREEAQVFLPPDVRRICHAKDFSHVYTMGRCGYGVENADSFALARKRIHQFSSLMKMRGAKPVLVLNLANPVRPGGGVRHGARAQEEDLCRKSSLLQSLESREAKVYYDYNRSLHSDLGSDAVMISPHVEIIRDENGDLLEETSVVAVMTCAAPILTNGRCFGLSNSQYETLMLRRITGMLKVAAYLGYEYLVLGAFGCGAFENDAKVVSDLFYKALKEFDFDGMSESDMFRRIDFAVLCRPGQLYNYREFSRNFDHFYRDEDQEEINMALERIRKTEVHLDAIRGCMLGGAAGDALGFASMDLMKEQMDAWQDPDGIAACGRDAVSGKKRISCYTQLSLFTAVGLLVFDTRFSMRGVSGLPRAYVHEAVSDWKKTQASTFQEINRHKRYSAAGGSSWLLDVPELYARRLPAADPGELPGVSWILPLALRLEPADLQALDQEGASLAELLLDHDLAPMTAAVLTHIISRIIYPPEGCSMHFRDIVLEARDTVAELYAEESETQRLVDTIDRALQLSEQADGSIEENARPFGEGRSPDEILGISLYCALRHPDHFSDGVRDAVRYGGDQAAAGALTGSLLGALLGYSAIPDAWKQDLELDDVILETADDLCHGCQMSEYSHYEDPDWEEKYMHMRRPMRKLPMVFFWKENQENGWFSNWFRKPFVVDGVTYSFVEKYMMAEKARLFHDTERYDAILQAEYPWECKELGRQVTPFDSAAWNAVKYDVVKTASRAKYEQNPELMARLLQTGDALLAEASPSDRVWGIGLDASDAAKNDPRDWPGENLMGRILMELRAEFTDKVTHVSGTILRAVTGEQAGTSAAEAVIRTDRGIPGVKITTPHNVRPEAGGSSYRYVIHTSSLFRSNGNTAGEETLTEWYLRVLQAAVDRGIRGIAFPSVPTGASGGAEEEVKTTVRAVSGFAEKHPEALDLIEWVLPDEDTRRTYMKVLEQLRISRIVHSPKLDEINRMLRDGLV